MAFNEITVMICDDSLFARRKMREYLLSLDVKEIYEATDGEEAVDKYKEFSPSVVFMDIVMPKKTGVEALREIMAYDKKAKVVMATSAGTQGHLLEAIGIGAYEFMQKPLENEQIYKILEVIAKG